MNPSAQITEEDLADGKMLEQTVSKFNSNRNNDTFIDVIEILRDSIVYVPYNAVLSDRDQERFEEIINKAGENLDELVGLEFVAKDETRLIPDILENNGNYFFPIFLQKRQWESMVTTFLRYLKVFLMQSLWQKIMIKSL